MCQLPDQVCQHDRSDVHRSEQPGAGSKTGAPVPGLGEIEPVALAKILCLGIVQAPSQVEQQGSFAALLHQPASSFVEAFINAQRTVFDE